MSGVQQQREAGARGRQTYLLLRPESVHTGALPYTPTRHTHEGLRSPLADDRSSTSVIYLIFLRRLSVECKHIFPAQQNKCRDSLDELSSSNLNFLRDQ